jgi:hypothetical protein
MVTASTKRRASTELEKLHDMLNELWHADRKTSTSDELALYAGMEDDLDLRNFLDDLELKKRPN